MGAPTCPCCRLRAPVHYGRSATQDFLSPYPLRMTRRGSVTVMTLAVLLLLVGCSQDPSGKESSTPSESSSSADPGACDGADEELLDTVRSYVEAYDAPVNGESGSGASEVGADDGELRDALGRTRRTLDENGCDLKEFRTDFRAGMDDIKTRGPLANAVLLRLTASMTGTLARTPETVTVRPGQDLPAALARLAPGSTAVLSAGDHGLRQPLVLLSGVTLRGQGQPRTSISSTAAGSAILVLTDERTELRDLTLRHQGRKPSSLLVGGPSSSVVLTRARLTGATASGKAAAGDQSGSAVTMTARAGNAAPRGTTIQVTASDFVDNDVAGLLLTGAHRASIRRTTFRANGQCGVCFAGKSSGGVQRGAFRNNGVGVAVLDQATPTVTDNDFEGGQVAIQVSGRAAPAVRRARIDGPSRAGLIFGDRSSGRVDGARCQNITYGIVVAPQALPFIGRGNKCPISKGR